MRTVYKYPVQLVDTFTLALPDDAEILHVAEQSPGQSFMWALIDPTAPTKIRTFRLAGTGHPIFEPVTGRHVATFYVHGGSLVFHLFDVTPRI